MKSLYYLRSKSVQRSDFAGGEGAVTTSEALETPRTDYEECLACQ